ncbi:MAG: glycosyltransferase [Bacteroidetes bacterium]|nr:glycosyltransferase [Bacteroidota bacterium]
MLKAKTEILNVLTSVDDGGLEMLVYRIYRGLDKDKYKFMLVSLTPRKYNFLERDFEALGTEIYYFDFRNKGKGPADALHNLLQYIRFIKFLVTKDFDIIHSHDFFPALVARTGVLLGLKKIGGKKIKVFSTYHNIYYWLKPVHRRINKFLSRFTDRIVCVSSSVKEDSLLKEKINQDKFRIIHNGVEETEFFADSVLRKNTRASLGYSDSDFVIGNVAVLSERKDQLTLLKAFGKIRHDFPHARMLLLGGVRAHEEDYHWQLVKFIRENDLDEIVKIHEPVKEVNPIYNALDLFIMPSVTEGFGLSAFEAMLTEKICLFSDIPPFLELVDDKINAFIFKVSDSESLAGLLNYVLSNYKGLKYVEKVSREYVIAHYSLKDMVKKYDMLYTEN